MAAVLPRDCLSALDISLSMPVFHKKDWCRLLAGFSLSVRPPTKGIQDVGFPASVFLYYFDSEIDMT